MLDRLDETIVAISSAAGSSPLGIVRLSGPAALSIVERMSHIASGPALPDRPGSTRMRAEVIADDDVTLQADLYLFRKPHSYTRQDMVEIHTIGSPPVLELIRRRAVALGALPAEPGEFTARAFLNGAMDLAAAEGVAGVIRAQSDAQLRASRQLMDGVLSARITELRDELAELVALVEADIDFAEEPIEFITPPTLRDRLNKGSSSLDALLAGSASVERSDALPRILLFGPPNSGKSLLMNRLSGISRAICAAAAGTTRDILSAPIRLGRGEAILLDSAGVDPSEDDLITQAREMTLSTAERVDLVCLVVDVTDPDPDHVLNMARSLDVGRWVIAANKCDLVSSAEATRAAERMSVWNLCHCSQAAAHRKPPVCLVSALEETGLNGLRTSIAEALGEAHNTTSGEAVALSERQRSAIGEALEALHRAGALAETASETIDCGDVLAFELREALDILGTVTGEVTTDDLLSQVFANFCIGK